MSESFQEKRKATRKWRIFKILSLVLVCILVTLPIAPSTEATGELQLSDKFSEELQTVLGQISNNDQVELAVFFQDIDPEIIMNQLKTAAPEEYEEYVAAQNMSTSLEPNHVIQADLSLKDGGDLEEQESPIDAQLLQEAIEHKRELYKNLYAKLNRAILNSAFPGDEQIFVSSYAPFAIVKTDKQTALSLDANSSVTSIYLCTDQQYQNEDLGLANQISRADYVRDSMGYNGYDVKIGQIELGVPDVTDPSLSAANIVIKPGSAGADLHATYVASILVGTDSSGSNDGLAPAATLYACSVEYDTDCYEGIEWLISQGVNVVNMSAGGSRNGLYNSVDKWVDHVASVHDLHFVKSAGNHTRVSHNYIVTSPGMAYNAITVGGLDAHNSDTVSGFTLSTFSCYNESDDVSDRAEKPNLVASATNVFPDAPVGYESGTSYSAPQVTGVIAQLCDYKPELRIKQTAVGAILMASAAEKVNAVGSGAKGDSFISQDRVNGNSQISDKEGAGILDSQWARGIAYYGNYWSPIIYAANFPYEQEVTISTYSNTMTRVCIFWLKRNSIDHSTNTITESPLANLDLYVYGPDGNLLGSSTTTKGNFEIVQFVPTVTGTYRIQIRCTNSDLKEYVGIAVW